MSKLDGRLWFLGGQFYAEPPAETPVAVAEGPHGRVYADPVIHVWSATGEPGGMVTMVPLGAHPVTIGSPSGHPDDRAVAAEMAAADARARQAMAEGRVRAAESRLRGVTEGADRRASMADQARMDAEQARVRDLRAIAEKVAAVYGRTDALAALNGPDEGGYGSWCDVHDELWGDHDHDRIDPARLLEFIAATLDLDHPAVRFPQPGPATIANACVLARTELTRHGATLDDVAEAIVRMAAEPQRPD